MASTDSTTPLPFATLNGVSRLSALEAVRARIALAVDLGLLAPGDRLPGTAQIASGLGVGEITVRRALVSLCTDGVLERRRGRNGGTHVAENPTHGTVAGAEAYRSDSAAVHRLIDHRLALECGIAHLASAHASQDDLSELQDLVDEMDQMPSWAEFHGCDERFHLRLAQATGIPSITTPTVPFCASSTATTCPIRWKLSENPTRSTVGSSTPCAARTRPRPAKWPDSTSKCSTAPCSSA